MTGTIPVSELAPLEYCSALDAARVILGDVRTMHILCDVPALLREVNQRFPTHTDCDLAAAALWVEPMADTWQDDARRIAEVLERDGRFAVVASLPLARLVPERRSWPGQALGVQAAGLRQLRRTLSRLGLRIDEEHGFHSVAAVGWNTMGQWSERFGRRDVGDRMHFKARLRYRADGLARNWATVTLLCGRRTERRD